MTILRNEQLDNGLSLVFSDESNRYFGDYHRICIVASIMCHLDGLVTNNDEEQTLVERAKRKFGDTLIITRRFERMGVATADVETVSNAMIDDFLQHTAPYLSRPEYPLSLVKAELNKKPVPRFYV